MPLNAPISQSSVLNVFAPQGRVPVQVNSLHVPFAPSRPDSRPDFIRGFGLDIPEEEEPLEEEVQESMVQGVIEPEAQLESLADNTTENVQEDIIEPAISEDAKQIPLHTRHASRISVALSVGSVGRLAADPLVSEAAGAERDPQEVSHPDAVILNEQAGLDDDSAGDWTGSDDLQLAPDTEASENEGVCCVLLSTSTPSIDPHAI